MYNKANEKKKSYIPTYYIKIIPTIESVTNKLRNYENQKSDNTEQRLNR